MAKIVEKNKLAKFANGPRIKDLNHNYLPTIKLNQIILVLAPFGWKEMKIVSLENKKAIAKRNNIIVELYCKRNCWHSKTEFKTTCQISKK